MEVSLRSVLFLAAAVIPLAAADAALADEPKPAAAAPRELTMELAIEIALAHNPQLAIEAENVVAAQARSRADSRLRLPLLNVRTNVLFWDRAIVVKFGDEQMSQEITVRDRVTGTADVTVSQPLSGALVIGKLVERDQAAAAN